MRCQLCGAQTHPGHPYCPRCAYEVTRRQGQQIPIPQRNPMKGWALASLAFCALAAAGYQAHKVISPLLQKASHQSLPSDLGVKGSIPDGALKANATATDPTLQAQADPTTPVLEAPQQDAPAASLAAQPTGSSVLSQPATTSGLPADVGAWIDHLRQIEMERQSLTKSQVGRATSLLGAMQASQTQDAGDQDSSASKIAEATGTAADIQHTWGDLDQRFLSVKAPTECIPLQVAYDRTLKETGAMISGIMSAFESAGNDQQGALNKLSAMQGQSTARIDTPARDADALLRALYNRYGVPKEFSISADIAP